MLKVGFIGLGMMGSMMVQRLLEKNCEVMVSDIDKEKENILENFGATVAPNQEYLAENSAIIMSSLPNPQIVKAVFCGENGILNHAKEGTTIIDLSSIDPTTSREIAKEASQKGIKMLDAPVSGGPAESRAGTLVLMVGGDKEVFDENVELMNCLAKNLYYAGDNGCGCICKLVNNTLGMGNVLLAAEGFVFGTKAGVSPDVLFEIITHSGGTSHHLQKRFPYVLKRDFGPRFTVDLARKDIGLAIDMAKSVGATAILTSVIEQLYRAASLSGNGGKDCAAVVQLFENWAGVEVKGKDAE